MTKHVNRRIFLRGLGGAIVAAPFLASLADRSAKAAAPRPKRLILMFTHNGCITTRFFPAKSHGALSAADLQSTTLAPLAPFASKLLIPRGIRAMNEWTAKMERGQGNDPHLNAVGTFLTCQPLTPNSNDPFSFNTATKFNAKPIGPSLDHVIAQQLSPNGQPLLMRVLNDQKESQQTAVSYSASETVFQGTDRASAFAKLTGLFQPGGMLSPDSYQAARGKSIIDLVRHDLESLERVDMSRADKQKLEAWKQLLHETTNVIVSAQCTSDVATRLGATPENVASTNKNGSDSVTAKVSDSLDRADVYSSIAVLSAVCNVNPVIFLKYPQDYVFAGIGVNVDSESLANRTGNANSDGPCVDDAIALLLKIDTFYAQKFAKLVGMLDDVSEGDGLTVLDNTAAVWLQEFSDGAAMNLNNLPIIQAGSCAGHFKTGWAVNVEDGSATLSNGNSESACTPNTTNTISGISQSTGTDAKLANAPINKYYCNLMNAMGVKAGKDGFPAQGGSEEVRCFGMYDRTEDFIGGGTNPPKINSPGGFDALEA
ncbi:MAG TPA: DUF1552 domain-containing protein [Polyangiaceae bacterium]|nr:DUF1552 domain-containing protein [Polyangiaceae bacterium]